MGFGHRVFCSHVVSLYVVNFLLRVKVWIPPSEKNNKFGDELDLNSNYGQGQCCHHVLVAAVN